MNPPAQGEPMWGPTGFSGVPSRTDEGVCRSLMAGLGYTARGVRFVLLDAVRDADFLSTGGLDAGLGIVDDPKFVFSSVINPSTKQPRGSPVKFFWLGSPLGTNDATDSFSLFVADVLPEQYYAGAPASVWLTRPRKVIDVARAGADIVTWFDTNYPGGAAGGVGGSNSGSNTAYGILASAGSVGNVSRMATVAAGASIDGQIWPVYDRVDGSWLLYFSIKTANPNTLAIYCYKQPDTEMSTPVTSNQFLGGLYGSNGVTSAWFPATGAGKIGTGNAQVLSSHRFSLLSPDPLNTLAASVTGQQTAVFAYSYLAFDYTTPDHGADLAFAVVADLHAAPLAPAVGAWSFSAHFDSLGMPPVDKLGSIHACPRLDNESAGYAVLFNSPGDRDVRVANNDLVLGGMELRVAYWHPASGLTCQGGSPLKVGYANTEVGACRPQLTDFPDGAPKVLYAQYSPDQTLRLMAEYVDWDVLSPDRQKRLLTGGLFNRNFSATTNPVTLYTYGKRRARVVISGSPNLPTAPNTFQHLIELLALNTMDYSFAAAGVPAVAPTNWSVISVAISPLHINPGMPELWGPGAAGAAGFLEFELEDLPPFLSVNAIGPGQAFVSYDKIELRDD